MCLISVCCGKSPCPSIFCCFHNRIDTLKIALINEYPVAVSVGAVFFLTGDSRLRGEWTINKDVGLFNSRHVYRRADDPPSSGNMIYYKQCIQGGNFCAGRVRSEFNKSYNSKIDHHENDSNENFDGKGGWAVILGDTRADGHGKQEYAI